MFRDHAQASRAIHLLLANLGIQALWADAGPTTSAVLLRYESDVPLPPEERTLLLAAWSLWTPIAAGLSLAEVVRGLDRDSLAALCSLIVAYAGGADAVDAWIEAAVAASPRAARGDEAGAPQAAAVPRVGASPAEAISADWPTLDALSLRYVQRVLDHLEHNKTRTAAVLGVDRRTVNRLVTEAQRGGTPTMQTQRRRASKRRA